MTPLARNLVEFAPRWQSLLGDAKTDLYEQAARKPLNLDGYLGALDLVAALDRVIAHQDGLAEAVAVPILQGSHRPVPACVRTLRGSRRHLQGRLMTRRLLLVAALVVASPSPSADGSPTASGA